LNQTSPRINLNKRMIAIEESLHGAIHERQHPLRIYRRPRAAQLFIARHNHPGLRARRGRFRRGQRLHRPAHAQQCSPGESLLEKISAAVAVRSVHSRSPLNLGPLGKGIHERGQL